MNNNLAQLLNINNPSGTQFKVQGPLVGIESIGELLSLIVNTILFPIAGVILFLILIWGGYDFIMAQGEAEKVQSGKQKITSAIVGFFLLAISYFLAKLIGYIFGVGGGAL